MTTQTQQQILDDLQQSSDIPLELRSHLLQSISGQCQFIHNMLHTDNFQHHSNSQLIKSDSLDFWQDGYNHGVKIYQQHVVTTKKLLQINKLSIRRDVGINLIGQQVIEGETRELLDIQVHQLPMILYLSL